MNTKVWIAVAVIVVLGVIGYLVVTKKSSTKDLSSTTNQTANDQNTSQTQQTQKRSLKDIMASGTQKCQWSDGVTTGTLYTASNKTRMDYSTTAGGQTVSGHAIMDGTTYYSWTDGTNTGFKM